MRLKVQTFINNEFRISVQSDNSGSKKVSDTLAIKRNTKYHTALQKVQYLDKSLSKLLSESSEVIKEKVYESTQLGLLAGSTKHTVSYNVIPVLPKTYKCLSELPDGRFVVKNVSTDELLRERQRQLDIISESQQVSPKHSSYGKTQTPKSFTKTARHRLLEAGAAVDLLGLKDSSSLLTLTLPGGTEEAKKALADWSGWIVNRQTQLLRRNPKFKNTYWFFVWEWQDRGALHQHWCISAETYEIAKSASLLLKSMWYQLLDEIGFNLGIDMYMRSGHMHSWKNYPKMWVWNEQQVKKSVGSYFAKYASKEHLGAKKKPDLARQRLYFPSRWFGSSSNIKEICKAYRVEFSVHNIDETVANKLSEFLIAELEQFPVVKRYSFEFEAVVESEKNRVTYQKQTDRQTGELSKVYRIELEKREDRYVACYGKTEILYVNPVEFIGAFGAFVDWFNPVDRGIFSSSPIFGKMHFVREQLKDDVILQSEVSAKVGRLNVFC